MREITSAPKGCCWLSMRLHRERLSRSRGRAASRRPSSCRGRTRSRSVRPVVSPGSTSISRSSHDDRGDLEVGGAQRAAERAHDLERHAQLEVVHRREQALEVGAPGPRASAPRARGSASAPRAAGSRGGRRRRAPPSAASASGGTSTTRSSSRRRAAREPPAVLQLLGRERARVDGRRAARLPSTTRTLHFLQVPWPPQVESIAIPFQLAASKIVVPAGHARLLRRRAVVAGRLEAQPDAVLLRRHRRQDLGSAHDAAAACFSRCDGDPARAPLVVAEQQVGRAHGVDALRRARVHDRARQPVALRHRQERGAERVPPRQAERHVRGAAGHVHAELVADQRERLERERDRVGSAPTVIASGSMTTSSGGMP